MRLSCFTPLGLLELSGREAKAKSIYRAMVAAHGGQFDMTPGESHQEAKCFATAIARARADKALARAHQQAYAARVDELLPVREQEFGIVPPWNATFTERRAEVVRRRARPDIWNQVRIAAALQELIGDDFIAYRPTPLADADRWPAALGDQPQNLQLPSVARKLIRITQPITVGLGAPQAVTYELVSTPQSPDQEGDADLIAGDSVVVEPEIFGITETVVVAAVTGATFTATFDKPHTTDCLGSTAPYPKWVTTKRHNLVIVTPAAAIDAQIRRSIDTAMRRMVRASSTWDIVDSADGLVTGSFVIGTSLIGSHTITSVTI